MDIVTHRVDGVSAGPHLLIMGGVHGDEFEPMEAVRQLRQVVTPQALRGRLTLAPVVNEPAFLRGHRTADDERDLARTFPGRADGSITERVAHAVTQLIRSADYVIDLHTGGTQLAVYPLAGYMLHSKMDVLRVQRRMARAFGLPIVWGTTADLEGRSMSVCRDANIPAIYTEYYGSAICRTEGVSAYVLGCLRVMSELEMLNNSSLNNSSFSDVECWALERDTAGTRIAGQIVVEDNRPSSGHMQVCHPAPRTGYWRPVVALGQVVTAGARLGMISDPLGDDVVTVTSDRSGMVIVMRTFPRVLVGDALAVVMELTGSVPDATDSGAEL